jgi:serine/threonine-protein kinase
VLTEVPGYRLAEPLAHGRRGPLRAGVQVDNHQRVVVHLVQTRLDRTARARLQARGRQLRELPPAPPVVPLLAAGTTSDGHVYLVTPRMERSLADLLRADGPLPLDLVLSAGNAILGALSVLHASDVLHGNITPANLLIRADGGIALADPRIDVLDEAVGAGPVVHWPPEAARSGQWTTASDVYMAGSTLWTLLTGRPPYPDLPSLLGQRLPALERGDTPDALAHLLRSMLAPEPADRPPDTAGLTRTLEAVASGAGLGGARPGGAGAGRRRDLLDTDPGPRPELAAGLGHAERARTIGRYRIRERLGTGGSATVWRAEDERGRPVAVKELKPEFRAHPDAVHRFRQELSLLPELDHAHLVPALELIIEDDVVALVMPLYGTDLRRVLSTARMETRRYVEALRQVAAALAYLHRRAVVHRDVKPDNVLVERRDPVLVRLTDLGIARIPDLPGVTASDGQPGTLPYMAPELFGGGPVTPAIDVYAFGVTAYELLTGRRPFEGTSAAVMNGHLRLPPTRPPAVSAAAWDLLVRCLAKDAAARPTADDLPRLLRALPEAGLGGQPARPPAPTTVRQPPRQAPLPTPAGMPAHGRDRSPRAPTAGKLLDVVAVTAPTCTPASADTPAGTGGPALTDKPLPATAKMIKLAVAVTVIGVLIGGLWALRDGAVDLGQRSQGTAPPSATADPAGFEQVTLAATATSLERGVITVSWAADPRAGVASETSVIVLTRGKISFQESVGQDTPNREYTISPLDGDTQYCVTVQAFVPESTAQPTSQPDGPTCLTADGRGQTFPASSPRP